MTVDNIPVFDFSLFTNGTPLQKQQTCSQIVNSFQNLGFIYLTNHGIAHKTVTETFAYSKSFFEMSQNDKDLLAWQCPESNRGYACQGIYNTNIFIGREKVTLLVNKDEVTDLRTSTPDHKESCIDDVNHKLKLVKNLLPNIKTCGQRAMLNFTKQ
jgi:isopenicillin N synthase-like dioxygenase